MKLIFDWADSFSEEKENWRGDAEIISLEISHRECSFASAKVLIYSKNTDIWSDKKYVKIGVQLDEKSQKIKLLFTGRLISFPIGLGNSYIRLEFIAEADDYQKQLKDFSERNLYEYRELDKHTDVKRKMPFDDLFFSEKDAEENATVFLEGDTKLFFWDMKNGKLLLSDINTGNRNIKITSDQIFQNSLRVRLSREPYRNIKISVSAQWIQNSYGYVDMIPIIAKRFKYGIINSYTNLKTGIEKLFNFSHKSGYRLIECNVKEIIPAKQFNLTSLPMTSKEFLIKEEEPQKTQQIKFRRFYFDGSIVINWHYKQKRIETANINIINTKNRVGREKYVHIKLNSIQLPKKHTSWKPFKCFKVTEKVNYNGFVFECLEDHFSKIEFEEEKWRKVSKTPDALSNDSQGSFFSTPRGKNSLRYAIQKSIALMNYSSRYIEISFTTDAKNFLFSTLHDQVTLVDSRFKNGSITGKIIRTKFFGNSKHKIMQISIACSDLNDEISTEEKLNRYLSELLIENDKVYIKPDDIVTGIEVFNSAEEQEDILLATAATTASELKSQLMNHKTKIKIKLHPLNTMRVITRNINLPDFKI